MELEEQELFHRGEYFTAMVKVKGKKELIKIRGIVGTDYMGYTLNNEQGVGEEADCNEDFSYSLHIDSNLQEDLDRAGVQEFRIVKDRRQMAVIDGDRLPEVMGHQPKKMARGTVAFGCGAVELSKKQITSYIRVFEKVHQMPEFKDFVDVLAEVSLEEDVSNITSIKLADLKRLIE